MAEAEYCSGDGCPQRDNCSRFVMGMNDQHKENRHEPGWDGQKCDLYYGN